LFLRGNEEDKIFELMEFLREEFREITSLQYTINNKGNDTIYDLDIITHSGSDTIYEHIGNLKFGISAKSFFQTNTEASREALCLCERVCRSQRK
jgi:23S rRNA (uracil1939-C5)-methyltransferase